MRHVFFLAVLIAVFTSGSFSWETAIAGVLTTAPAQGIDGRLYSTADDRALHCLDSITGHEYWKYRPGGKLKGFTVISPDSSILILTFDNILIAVSPGGRELWRFPMTAAPSLPPAVDSYGTIYLMKADKILLCLDRTGQQVWSRSIEGEVADLFALPDRILLIGSSKTDMIFTDGSDAGTINESPRHLVFKSPDLFWQGQNGLWQILDFKNFHLSSTDAPLSDGTLYPDDTILISYENKIISGRKDWFLEAMEAGEEAYDPFYQSGSNPGRSRSTGTLPGQDQRIQRFADKSGAPLLPLLMIDHQFLNQILKEYEGVNSFQELIRKDADYDLVFQEILSDSHVVSQDVNRERLDEYSRYRIYSILCRWGNLNARETLLFLSQTEQNSLHLSLILDGLGRIGLDVDGRSMASLKKAVNLHPRDTVLLLSAVKNASLLAKYNGGRAILNMMNFYSTLQNGDLNAAVSKQIRIELKSF